MSDRDRTRWRRAVRWKRLLLTLIVPRLGAHEHAEPISLFRLSKGAAQPACWLRVPNVPALRVCHVTQAATRAISVESCQQVAGDRALSCNGMHEIAPTGLHESGTLVVIVSKRFL